MSSVRGPASAGEPTVQPPSNRAPELVRGRDVPWYSLPRPLQRHLEAAGHRMSLRDQPRRTRRQTVWWFGCASQIRCADTRSFGGRSHSRTSESLHQPGRPVRAAYPRGETGLGLSCPVSNPLARSLGARPSPPPATRPRQQVDLPGTPLPHQTQTKTPTRSNLTQEPARPQTQPEKKK